ncbi:autotransporter outer membrane beta-barrel domain-containing protein [Bosea sp. (in: a-proteobacteria)]|uniref:autotransporter outer membrane beta-barrel domain-containing protein n=1 Tax=Bosea sp. (in: a-proteobacteria) TaxID=1871050 RepID=UPI003B3A6D33
MLGSAARRALFAAGLPVLLLAQAVPLAVAQAADVTINTTTTGANGANGADDLSAPGNGAAGLVGYQYGQTGTVTVNQAVTGGAGGAGGSGASNWGTGGTGGTGLEVTLGGTAAINATVSGGSGGTGGRDAFTNQIEGDDGAGGAGLVFTNGGTALISATVRGGQGVSPGVARGGAGIVGAGLTVRLGASATVAGGRDVNNLYQSASLVFTGGDNILSLQAGAILTGGISLGTNTTTLQFDQSNDYTLVNNISGGGSVSITGGGVLTLTGNTSHTGGTTISAGALRVGNGGVLGTIAGNVVNNAALIFDRSDATSFSGAISGTGSVTKEGLGALTLTGTNSYAGGTTINSGTLRVGNGGTSGSITGNVVNNGVLAFDRSDTTSFAGAISGTGSLTKDGLGTLTLTGTNSYAGGTTINSGTLRVGNGGSSGSITGDVVNNGVLAFDRSDTTSFAGTISGTGSLTKDALGALTLTGTNTYTGGTTIANGSLRVGNGGTSGSIAGNVVNTAVLIFDRSDATSFAGAISGVGRVAKNGAGTLTLTGTNSYTGGTVINAGTLRVGNGGTSGAIIGEVWNNGVLAFDRSDTTSFAGAISGTGSVSKNGTGTLTLTGTNTYTGGTTINAGALRIGDGGTSGSITGDVVNNGTLAFVRSDSISFGGTISGTGGLGKGGVGTLTLTGGNTFTGGTVIVDGTLQIGDGGTSGSILSDVVNLGTLAFNRSDTTSFAGVISGNGGVSKIGAGKLTLTGTSTYTGPTSVSAGTLSVNGSIASSSSVTVNPGGTLGGSGTVGTTTIAGGTLAPGNSIGTLSVAGNLSFSAGSTYAVEVSPSDSDRVNVSGTATLGGATVAASFAAGIYVAKQYTILNATGGVSGTFGSKVDTNLPSGFKSSLGYDANNAYLNLALDFTPAPTAAPTAAPAPASTAAVPPTPAPTSPIPNRGLNPNQTAAANALTQFFDRTGGIPVVFGSLTPAGLSQAAGEPATGTPQTSVNAMGQFMATLADVSPEGRGVSIAPGPTGFAGYSSSSGKGSDLPAKQLPLAADPDAWRWSVWAGGFGTAQFVGADAGAGTAASTNRIYGAIAGADYRISRDTIAGFALGGGATSFNTYGLGSGSSDLFQAGAFIRQRFGASYVSAALGYAWQDVTTDRSITGADHLQARFNANTWSGRVEAGHRFGWAAFGVTPYAAAQVTTVALPGYSETALTGTSPFALSYAGRDTTRTRSELGLRADADLAVAHLPLKLQGGIAWVHNYTIGNSAIATFLGLPGATFSVNGAALDRNALRTTASAELTLGKGLSLAALFEGEFAANSRSFGGKGALRYSW